MEDTLGNHFLQSYPQNTHQHDQLNQLEGLTFDIIGAENHTTDFGQLLLAHRSEW